MTLETAVCEYFLLFSKLEYALKNAGFVESDSSGNAKPKWGEFVDHVYKEIEIDFEDEDIKRLIENPARRQMYRDNKLTWSNPQNIAETDKKRVLENCRTIRNNLFHGGKHGDGNAGRNKYLLRAATKILNAAIKACPKVGQQLHLTEL